MDYREIGRQVSNWGRWGEDDRIGTLNHLTPARVAAAAAGVRTGRVVTLGLPLSATGVQLGVAGRVNPIHLMSITPADFAGRPDGGVFSDDYITMPLQSVTQWDGLAHVGYDHCFYNNVPASTVTTMAGSTSLSIDQVARHGVVGRGVLLDIARLRGVDRLAPGEAVTPADLDAAEARQGVRVEPGDILLVRTGWLRVFTVDGSAPGYWDGEPGLTLECASWLHAREVAAVASDNWGVEQVTPGVPLMEVEMPFHFVAIRDMGMTLGEIFVLDELADACEAEGRWSFFFNAPPLAVVGGVGSPITPVAVF